MTDIIMGQMITGLVNEDADCRIVAGIDIVDNRDNDYPVFTDIDTCDIKADVIIDFSSANGFEKRMDYAAKTGTPIVQCSTGMSQYVTRHQSFDEAFAGGSTEALCGGL